MNLGTKGRLEQVFQAQRRLGGENSLNYNRHIMQQPVLWSRSRLKSSGSTTLPIAEIVPTMHYLIFLQKYCSYKRAVKTIFLTRWNKRYQQVIKSGTLSIVGDFFGRPAESPYLEVVGVGLAQVEVLLENVESHGGRQPPTTQELPVEPILCQTHQQQASHFLVVVFLR